MERAFLEQGNHELKQGKYQAAINSFKNAIARHPQLVEAHYGCGLAAEKLGRHKLAQDCFTTVVKLKSKPTDEIIFSKSPTIETTSSLEADSNASQENSVMAGITLFLFLLTMMLRTVVFIGYIADRPSSHSKPHVNSQAVESMVNLNKRAGS